MITGIILASGFSKRMGKDKLLIEIDGIKIVERVIRSCRRSLLDEIILVYRKEEVKNIGDKYNVKTLYNPNAHLGQSEGLKLGIKEAKNSEAYMFLVGDQPFMTNRLIDKLIHEYKTNNSSIIVPYYKGKKGTPTIFSSLHRNELLKVQGDKGGRDIIRKNPSHVEKVYIGDGRMGVDIDRPEDLSG